MAENFKKNFELEEDTQKGRYLTFNIGEESYGIEIKYVTEIIGMQSITQVPEVPNYIKGIINLRGKIIPVIDIRLRFKKEAKEYNDRTCIIVIDIEELSIGLIVDSVAEVLNIPDEDIEVPPQFNQGSGNRFIKNIGKTGDEVKLLLDCKKILTDEDIDDIKDNIQ